MNIRFHAEQNALALGALFVGLRRGLRGSVPVFIGGASGVGDRAEPEPAGFGCAGVADGGCTATVPVAVAGFAGAILKDSNFNALHPREVFAKLQRCGRAHSTARPLGRIGNPRMNFSARVCDGNIISGGV